jgi:hypothetical protein
MRKRTALCAFSAILAGSPSLHAQSTLSLTTSYAHTSQRDERASPLKYAGGLWGANLSWIADSPRRGWTIELHAARGILSSSITSNEQSTESATSAALRGGRTVALDSAGRWSFGAEMSALASVRIHTYTEMEGAFGEILSWAGPLIVHRRPLRKGTLRADAAISAIALLARPYSDARVARDGSLPIRVGLTHAIAAARARAAWEPDPHMRLSYETTLLRVRDDDHYGSLTHTVGLGIVLRRR